MNEDIINIHPKPIQNNRYAYWFQEVRYNGTTLSDDERKDFIAMIDETIIEKIMAKDRFDIKEREGMGLATHAYVIVDKDTGVNYLYVHCGYGGGLTPLLDKEGKPIISKPEEYQK